MKKILLFLFLSLCMGAQATTYYFSTSGSDANNGTSSATPFQTITKLNTLLTTALAGDIILLKRGDTWQGSITTGTSGVNGNKITIDAYGSGNKPVITGFTTLTGWTQIDAVKGIYESAAFTPAASNTVNVVTINGKQYAMGRTPNITAANGGYLTFEDQTNTTIIDNTNPFDNATFGNKADVVIRANHGSIERGRITAISGNTITFNNSTFQNFPSLSGYGYFVQNNPATLDQFGEWYYNPTTHKLSVVFGANNPASYTIQVSTIDLLFEPRSNNFATKHISFTGANQYGIWNDWNNVVNQDYIGVTVSYSGIDNFFLSGHRTVLVDSCVFSYANSNNVVFNFNNDNYQVLHSKINNAGMFPGMMQVDGAGRVGFNLFSSQQLTTGLTSKWNDLKNAGYIGIYFDHNNNLIQYTNVDSTCLHIDDGAGIYTDNFTAAGQTPAINFNNFILDNTSLHALGAPQGTGDNEKLAHAIYCDDNTNNIVIKRNTGAYCGFAGIFIHNTNRSTIDSNTFYNNRAAIYFQDDALGDSIYNNNVTNNTLLAASSDQFIYYMASAANNFKRFGFINNNKVLAPFSTNVAYSNWFGGAENMYTLATLRTTLGHDVQSSEMPVTVTDASDIIFKVNTTKIDRTIRFCEPLFNELKIPFIRKATIKPYQSQILFKSAN